jgi:hypothetical protein
MVFNVPVARIRMSEAMALRKRRRVREVIVDPASPCSASERLCSSGSCCWSAG